MTEWHARYGGPGVLIYWARRTQERVRVLAAQDVFLQ